MTAVDGADRRGARADAEPADASWIRALLQFDRTGDTFVARRPAGSSGRLFGGLIAAQALAAACATIGEGKLPQ